MNNPPHILTARLERAIVVNEHARYTAHCCGDLEKEDRLRLELDILNRQYWTSHGYSFHHNSRESPRGYAKPNGVQEFCRNPTAEMPITTADNYPTGLDDRDYRGVNGS